MDHDILQSTLDDLSHLFIRPEQLTLENDVELGVGGYGEVFLAVLESSVSQTKVAVKQLRIVQAKGIRCRIAIRLARELKVWATAKHPNILELLGFYLSENHGCAQLVSAYMANGNVKEYIDRLQPNLATRLRFVQGITSGISYLHNCSPAICHGDLKPTNVLVNESLDVVLCDFGLATFILESGASSGLTTSKSVKGSTRYMAPELFMEGGAKHTLESDVWAWACTTFEVLTDCKPFHNVKVDVIVMGIIVQGRAPGSVNLLESLVPDGQMTYRLTLYSLRSIIPDCWIMDSAERPSTSKILNRLIFPDSPIETLGITTASSHLSAPEDRQLELFLPPSADPPTYGDVKRKRKGSPGFEERLGKRARGKDAAKKTEGVRIHRGYGKDAISMNGHDSEVYNCRWNPLKSNVIVTGSVKGEVRLWNVPAPPASLLDPVVIEHYPGPVARCCNKAMEWDHTGAWLATGCSHGVLRVWTAEGALQSDLKLHKGAITSSMWSPSSLFLLSASFDGTVVVWDMRTPRMDKIHEVFRFHSGLVYDALWFDDETLISCGSEGHIHICRLRKQTPLRTFTGHEAGVTFLRLSKDKALLASSSDDLTIRVWNMDGVEAGAPARFSVGQTGPTQKWVLRGHDDEVSSLGWCPSPDPSMQYLLVSTSTDNTSRIWDARNGTCIKELRDHRDYVFTQSFSPRGLYLATGSADGRVLIYSSSTGTLLFEWDYRSGVVFDIQWQSAGDQLAVCLEDGGVAFLDTRKYGFGDSVGPESLQF